MADEKGEPFYRAFGLMMQGLVSTAEGEMENAVRRITSALSAYRSSGATLLTANVLSYLAKAHASLGQLEDAWRCIGDATATLQATEERWCEADVFRIAGEIALEPSGRDDAKAEAFFDRALAVARRQQAKSWELRAATAKARLWRDQGRRAEALSLLASVYGWFTEGFDTLDLTVSKAVLDELAS